MGLDRFIKLESSTGDGTSPNDEDLDDCVASAPKKLRAVTTSHINGRVVASSWRHMAATAIAWFRALIGKSPPRRGSANSLNLAGSLNIGHAYI